MDRLKQNTTYDGQIVHRQYLSPQAARFADPEQLLPEPLRAALADHGIKRLYVHQARALDSIRAGGHIGIVTATASGKSLCYQLPVLESIAADYRRRALFLFPTKALAQDQLRSLMGLTHKHLPLIRAGIYDGDTPQNERAALRANANILISNPDMLHVGILPNHTLWRRFLSNLAYVVVDEAHIYRGVFGSHVALVLRRLRRLCEQYGSKPQFICASATIGNPAEHLAALSGVDIQVIDDDGAPRGGREIIFWNPPLLNEGKQAGARRSSNIETTGLLVELLQREVKTLVFAKARKIAELIVRYAREMLERQGYGALGERLSSYRAGYLAEDRRRIEQALFKGDLLGVVATNAMELGVDIGGLDAVLLNGYPGTVASTWQQIGRAGRAAEHSIAFLVALEDPVDQYYMRHPEAFFGKSHEEARIALHNPYILAEHLRCAAYERPLEPADERWFGPALMPLAGELLEEGLLIERGGRFMAPFGSYPAQEVDIRSASGENIDLLDENSGRLIERVDGTRAFYELHPGAIHLHQGEPYLVTQLDIEQRRALARPADVRYYTQPRDTTDVRIEAALEQQSIGAAIASFGEVDVTRRVVGYRRKAHYTEEILGEHELDLPPQSFPTQAIWFTVPKPVTQPILKRAGDLPGGLHALEHAMIGVLPLLAMCDRWDIGGVSTPWHPDTEGATIFIYDGVPGGVGIAETGYKRLVEWWRITLDLLRECPCEEGCPSCVQSPKCGNGNNPLDKAVAIEILEGLLMSCT